MILYFAGHGYYYNGENVLACVDSLQRSISETTVNLKWVMSQFEKSNCKKVIVFLDCCHSGIKFSETERSVLGDFSIDDLKLYNKAEHLTVFSACKDNEKSQTDLERKHGAWSYYLLKALQGEADEDIYTGDTLMSGKLQKYLLENTKKRVKQITSEKTNQTPMMFGKQSSDFIVADLSALFEARDAKVKTEGVELDRAIILTSEEDWVRNLPGFDKSKRHTEPKSIDNYHENWIKLISQKLIEAELDEVFTSLKSEFKYKRKDIQVSEVSEGIGEITTLDFDYVIRVSQSKTDSSTYVITRSIENFKNSEILASPKFNQLFDKAFDEVEFYIRGNFNIEEIIDKIEDIDDPNLIDVNYSATDPTKCTIILKDFPGTIVIDKKVLRIIANKKGSPEQMLLTFKKAYEAIESHKIPKLLL